MILKIKSDIRKLADPKKAEILQRFFKTGEGEYGEGDIFLGLTVPKSRQIAKAYKNIPVSEIEELLHSKIHEERLIALILLVNQFKKGSKEDQKQIFDSYLRNTEFINNWDLVDLSAKHIIGGYLDDKKRDVLYKLASSKNVWERRIAIIATFFFINKNDFSDTVKISEKLIKDKHDLIQKAVGWVLRETGKKNKQVLENFLKKYHKAMPRTMLRYAIEKFPLEIRKSYLEGR